MAASTGSLGNAKGEKKRYLLRPAPHIHAGQGVSAVMGSVLVSLAPATLVSVILFGWGAAQVIIACLVGAIAGEALCLRLRGRPSQTKDLSAAVTGLLLALTMPPASPVWICLLGGFIAVALGKQVFGGLGANPFNPALVARAFLVISFPDLMTRWIAPFDGTATATPLAIASSVGQDGWRYFLGTHAGCLGETSVLALLLGGIYLSARRIIDWRIPTSILGTVVVVSVAFGADPLFQLLTGGLMLGALFMATDWVTTPYSRLGRLCFGIGVGLLTMIIRLWGGYPEGVSFAILFMNALTPLINLVTRPKPQMESVRQVREKPKSSGTLIRVLVTMGVVSAVSGIILAVFYGAMSPRIEKRRQQEMGEGFRVMFPDAASFEPVDLEERLPNRVNDPVFLVKDEEGERMGIAYVTTPAGFQGDITLAVGLDGDGERVVAVQVLAHTETAGLGSKITEPGYLQQYVRKRINDNFALGQDVDGIGGATVSAAAVANGLRDSARAVVEALDIVDGVSEASPSNRG
ncbi:MAG: RnfABCDGE type electron transport complex subunit D [Limnochordia bacterium]